MAHLLVYSYRACGAKYSRSLRHLQNTNSRCCGQSQNPPPSLTTTSLLRRKSCSLSRGLLAPNRKHDDKPGPTPIWRGWQVALTALYALSPKRSYQRFLLLMGKGQSCPAREEHWIRSIRVNQSPVAYGSLGYSASGRAACSSSSWLIRDRRGLNFFIFTTIRGYPSP